MASPFVLFFATVVLGLCTGSMAVDPATAATTQSAQAEIDLHSLRPEHPRLFLPDLDLSQLKEWIHHRPAMTDLHARLTRDAEDMLKQPPVERVLIGPRLLDKSRTALQRISLLAGLYRLDGDARLADRAIAEMLAVAAFEDWNPSHFLDVAEMTCAMGIGYDWLFDRLTPEQRQTIRSAIVDKGLRPGLAAYEKKAWWTKSPDNWNQVCNGGLTVGALAVADEEPQVAQRVLTFARRSIPTALAGYEPDGGWREGPGYWAYATQYTVYYLAALHGALGTDFGMSEARGLRSAGDFRLHSIGPTGLYFNFADAHPIVGTSSAMLYLAHRFNSPRFAELEYSLLRGEPRRKPDIFHLLWEEWTWKEGSIARRPATFPLTPQCALFRGIEVAFLRGRWDDPDATYVGFKGGDNRAGHAHLDLGTFVLDGQGQRWAIDLGPDDYNLPGYFGDKRFTYYRVRTEGQNTITLNGGDQALDAKAPIVAFSPWEAFAVADLTAAYPERLGRAQRGMRLIDDSRGALVQDEIDPIGSVDLVWGMHTSAEVRLDGSTAHLRQGGRELVARIMSPVGAKFALDPVEPPAPQKHDPSIRKLLIRLDGLVAPTRIVVVFRRPDDAGADPPALTPLSHWITRSPVQDAR